MPDKQTCSMPPTLTDEQLSFHLDGIADASVTQHLEVCSFCRTRLAEMKQYDKLLSTTLHRFDCPDSQQLTDFVMERLISSEREIVKQHLAFCAACQAEIQMLQDFLADEIEAVEPEPTAFSIPKRPYAADYVAHFQTPEGSVVRGKLRGKLRGPILASVSDSLNVFLEFDESVTAITLKGQIVVEDLDAWQTGLVKIFSNFNLIATATIGELGDFQCELEAVVPVQIRITAPSGETISIPEIMIDAE